MLNQSARVPHGRDFTLVDDEIIDISTCPLAVTCSYTYQGREVWLATDHFPGSPIMPGVKMIRAMADCALHDLRHRFEPRKKILALRAVRDIKFHRRVLPGTQLTVVANVVPSQRHEAMAGCEINDNGNLVASGTLEFREVENFRKARQSTCIISYTGKERWMASNHFPDDPIMPSEMILEAMNHGAIQIQQALPGAEEKIFLLQGIQNAHLYEEVRPDTKLILDAMVAWVQPGRRGIANCIAKNGATMVAEAAIEFAVIKNRS